MAALILDKSLERRLIARRRRLGIDRFDEVWDGVYVMVPPADVEHFEVASDLVTVLTMVVKWEGLGSVLAGVAISDRHEGWTKNFRVPDVTVFLNGTSAKNCGTHWFGGPDLAIEIVSPKDRSRKKIPFYEKVGTRELLMRGRPIDAGGPTYPRQRSHPAKLSAFGSSRAVGDFGEAFARQPRMELRRA
jgi:hypothetical protein